MCLKLNEGKQMHRDNNVNTVSFTKVKQQCNNVGEAKHRQVEATANKLVDVFGTAQWRKFYILAAYKLSEAQIWNNVEMSERKRNPGAWFHWKCKKDMDEQLAA
jgi:hypothetical protein